jgi:hypothetical protein
MENSHTVDEDLLGCVFAQCETLPRFLGISRKRVYRYERITPQKIREAFEVAGLTGFESLLEAGQSRTSAPWTICGQPTPSQSSQ